MPAGTVMLQPGEALYCSMNCSTALLAVGLVTVHLLGLTSAAAQTISTKRSKDAPPTAVRKLTREAAKELSAGKLSQAWQKQEQAYTAWPSLDGLYQLGRIAEAQGRTVRAADFYRRYLAAAGHDVDAQVKATLRAYITGRQEPTSEVDVASGDAGALLRLDSEVAGVLPLAGPLLVTAGEHRFTIEKNGQKFQTSPQSLSAGQRAQLQVTLESRYAVLTLTPALVLLIEQASIDEATQAKFFAAVAEAAQSERFFLIDREQTSVALIKLKAGRHPACAEDLRCQEGLARQLDAAAVLTIKAQGVESHISKAIVQLLDVPSGTILNDFDDVCASCSVVEARDAVRRATQKLLQEDSTRRRGTLRVASALAGARVLIDGRELGAIPFSREVFEGQYELVVQKDGYHSYMATAEVACGKSTEVTAVLDKVQGPVRNRRSVSPFPVGAGVLLGIGVVSLAAGIGLGARALELNGEVIGNAGPFDSGLAAQGSALNQAVIALDVLGGASLAAGGIWFGVWLSQKRHTPSGRTESVRSRSVSEGGS